MAAIKLDFSPKTFEKAKPNEIKGAGLLSALKSGEKALADEKKSKGDADSLSACIKAMQDVASAAATCSKKECDNKKHKDLVTALKKLEGDCASEIKRIEKDLSKAEAEQAEEEDAAASLDELLCVDTYDTMFQKVKKAKGPEDGPGFAFCFHTKSPEDCKLVLMMPAKSKQIVGKLRRQLPKIDSDYKKKHIISGTAFRDGKSLVLHLEQGESMPDVPGLAKKIKVWSLKNKSDISPMKKISLRVFGSDPIEVDMDDDDTGNEGTTATASATENENAGPQPQPQEQVAEVTTPPQAEAAQAPASGNEAAAAAEATPPAPPADGNNEAAVEDRRKEFRKARQQWQTTKEKAIQDVEAVKDGIRTYYMDDPEQFKLATSKLSQLDAVMDNLGDDLRDVLDKYVSTPKTRQSELQQLADRATATVESFLNYAQNDRLLNALDDKQFADVTVKAPIEKALKDLVKTLS